MSRRWVLRWDDREWNDSDLLGVHLMLMVDGTGVDGWDIMPTGGPRRLVSTLAAFISVDEHRDYAQVVSELLLEPAFRLLEALELVDVD